MDHSGASDVCDLPASPYSFDLLYQSSVLWVPPWRRSTMNPRLGKRGERMIMSRFVDIRPLGHRNQYRL
jgi:hypothetical protein